MVSMANHPALQQVTRTVLPVVTFFKTRVAYILTCARTVYVTCLLPLALVCTLALMCLCARVNASVCLSVCVCVCM